MNKVGFIGYGSMGSMLVNQLMESGALYPEQVYVSTRTPDKLNDLKELWPEVHIEQNNCELVKKVQYVFLCAKAVDIISIIDEIKHEIKPKTHLISITGGISLNDLREKSNAMVTKIIPSITSEVNSGVTLVCHDSNTNRDNAFYIENILSHISTVKVIEERAFDIAIDLTSCAPGFIAAIFEQYLNSACRMSDVLNKEEIEQMIVHTLLGTAKLFVEKDMSFSRVIERVATKGGITDEGVKVLRQSLPEVFDTMLSKTQEKRKVIQDKAKSLL